MRRRGHKACTNFEDLEASIQPTRPKACNIRQLVLILKDYVIDLKLKVVECLFTDSVPMVSLKKHIRPTRSVSVDSYHMNSKLSGPLSNGLVHEKNHHVVGPLHQKLNHASSLELTPKLEQVTSSF